MNIPSMTPFLEKGASGPVTAGPGARRTGCFAAKLYSTHRHRLEFTVGENEAGTIVHDSVQNWSTQTQAVRDAAKWVCSNPYCQGKTWPSKDACIEGHGDERVMAKQSESHCIFAVSRLPADVAEVKGIAHKKDTHVIITTGKRHGLNLGSTVVVKNVMAKDKRGGGEPFEHACNGTWLAIPLSVNTFAIECAGDGVMVHPSAKDANAVKPIVLLHPERPVLLSDEE
jgi:hypothetical protein